MNVPLGEGLFRRIKEEPLGKEDRLLGGGTSKTKVLFTCKRLNKNKLERSKRYTKTLSIYAKNGSCVKRLRISKYEGS